jgi:hypothetical protein
MSDKVEPVDADREIRRLLNAYRLSQAVHVAAVLGLSDKLATGPRSTAGLVEETGCDETVLRRLLTRVVPTDGPLALVEAVRA